MKIKNLRYGVAVLATSLSLVGCNYSSNYNNEELLASIESLEENFKDLEEEVVLLKEENQDLKADINIKRLSDGISKCLNDSLVFDVSYSDDSNSIDILIYNRDGNVVNLSDDFYYMFDSLLSMGYPCHLSLMYLESEIDFSKLNLSSVNEISFVWCSDKLDYEVFSYNSYDSIDFAGVPLDYAKKIMSSNTNDEVDVSYYPVPYSDEDKEFNFIRFLIDNNISIGNFNTISHSTNKELFNLLSCLNSDKVIFTDYSDLPLLEFDINLNDRIKDFSVGSELGKSKELGNIKLSSNNSDLYFSLAWVQVTDNTDFSLPDDVIFYLDGKVTDINPLYSLNGVKRLYYCDYETRDSVDSDELSFEQVLKEIEKFNDLGYVKKK